MNSEQKTATGVGIAIAVAMLAYPPWTGTRETTTMDPIGWRRTPDGGLVGSPQFMPQTLPTKYRYIFDPPPSGSEYHTYNIPDRVRVLVRTNYRIHWGRLLIQWAVVAGVMALKVSSLKDEKGSANFERATGGGNVSSIEPPSKPSAATASAQVNQVPATTGDST